jgi:hypothetical protein
VAVVHGGPVATDGRGARHVVLRCTKPRCERGEMERVAARSSPRASSAAGRHG